MSGKLSILTSILKTSFTRPPIVKDKVFVMTMDNRFSCNPEAIIKEVLKAFIYFNFLCFLFANQSLQTVDNGLNGIAYGKG